MRSALEIYIEPGCATCDLAIEIAAAVRERLPQVEVRLVDMTEPGVEIPEQVFAVPTYLVDGRVYSLGNPKLAKLLGELESRMTRTPHD